MSDSTDNLDLPYIVPNQEQKHVTHNEAIRALDAIVQLAVETDELTEAPVNPTPGSRYIIADQPTGGWAGKQHQIAAFQDGGWHYFAPQQGWLAFVRARNELLAFNGQGWQPLTPEPSNEVSTLGVNTSADAVNRLAVKSDVIVGQEDDI
ncbi:MAG: DUF2793 domain-containing protein, partial [Pseudomonadota bacterium]